MQHWQLNFVWHGTNALVVTIMLAVGSPAFAAKPDPLLDSGPTVPCAAGADYAAGIDANGNPVVPADVGAGPVPVPDAIAIPLARRGTGNGAKTAARNQPQSGTPGDSAYVSLDGRKLAPLLNPPPCL